jgi:hypothetical protein
MLWLALNFYLFFFLYLYLLYFVLQFYLLLTEVYNYILILWLNGLYLCIQINWDSESFNTACAIYSNQLLVSIHTEVVIE